MSQHTRNTDLFDKIADQIEKHPESHDQDMWGSDCGTKHCVAGWAAVFSGMQPSNCPHIEGMKDWLDIHSGDEDLFYLPDWAQEELGLTEDEAQLLFSGDWEPRPGTSVPGALRAIGRGGAI